MKLIRDDADHIAEMERMNKRPTQKWEVSKFRKILLDNLKLVKNGK